ncbi:unnamed protein product [Larinioides sclopetarius]|uniref:C2H2-type domain-containing protein n=1 Tax=Larinioides sclopetarius TaxID=280406 RepID=A0AAV2BVZ1_9ARAC
MSIMGICSILSMNPTSSQAINSIPPINNKKSLQCSFPGCKVIKKNKKALTIHRFREHKIPIPKKNIASSQVPGPSNINTTTIPPSSNLPDSPPLRPGSSPNSAPPRSCIIGDSLHLVFPLYTPSACPINGCSFSSKTKDWFSIKGSIVRHLRTSHHLKKLRSIHWCSTCLQKFTSPAKHSCLSPGITCPLEDLSEFQCSQCNETFPSQTGLRNHVFSHRKSQALGNATQLVIPRMSQKKWRRKRKAINNGDNLPPDEAITDPTSALAPPPDESVQPDVVEEWVSEEEQDQGPLSSLIDCLDDILRQEPSEDQFDLLCEVVQLAVEVHKQASSPPAIPSQTPKVSSQPRKDFDEFQFTKFLGKPVGFNPIPDYGSFNSFGQSSKKVLQSLFSAWQKIDAMKSFIYPTFQFAMRTGQFKKDDWGALDEEIRRSLKEVLLLPDRASNEYLYGHTKSGCLGIPIAAEESDLNRIDSTFKLITSRDELLAELAFENLKATTARRIKKKAEDITDDDISDFMSGDLEIDDDRAHSNPLSNVWTVARSASRRMKVSWLFDEGLPRVKFQDLTINSLARRKLLFTIRNRLRQDRVQSLVLKPDQGRSMECIAVSPHSSHFMTNGRFLRFSEFRFIHKARLNLLPLNGLPWKESAVKSCRRCNKANLETLSHVINHCEPHSRAWKLRHNSIQHRIVTAARNSKAEVLSLTKNASKT